MKLPIMLRSTHEALFTSLKANFDAVYQINEELISKCKEYAAENAVLRLQLAQKSVIITPDKPKEEPKKHLDILNTLPGRGAWRTRARLRSEKTMPKPKDSIAALQEKVKREGGTIDV
jgi:hypothetical protein